MGHRHASAFRKIASVWLIFALVLTGAFALCVLHGSGVDGATSDAVNGTAYDRGELIVRLNEIKNETEDGSAADELGELIDSLQGQEDTSGGVDMHWLLAMYLCAMALLAAAFLTVYLIVLRPFDELETFAGEIASGNLDAPLPVRRVNVFGEFTWAFDHMRREIKRARRCEAEAIENNRTVAATLSHDIKTPVASIRAYAEALLANLDRDGERRDRYIEVILRKCDEVTKITNDMFIHSLHNLDKLVIKSETVDVGKVLTDTVYSMKGDSEDIHLAEPVGSHMADGLDGGRLAQVIENIISNARKYAGGSRLDIWLCDAAAVGVSAVDDSHAAGSSEMEIHFRDHGKGIPPEDLPFVWDKFYRGHNAGEADGAGLGLFIVRYIMEQMGGSAELVNHTAEGNSGLEVVVRISYS